MAGERRGRVRRSAVEESPASTLPAFPEGNVGNVAVCAASLPIGGEGWRARGDGFTPKKRRRFIAALAETGCVSDAARVAGISTTSVDRWRGRDAVFAAACETALHMASAHIETLAWERAVIGIEEPVWHYGKRVGTRLKRSDAIFRLLLIGSNRKKYGRMGAVGRKALAKAERKRIEREVRTAWEQENPELASIRTQFLDRLDEERLRNGWTETPFGLVPPGWGPVTPEAVAEMTCWLGEDDEEPPGLA